MTAPSWKVYAYFVGGVLVAMGFGLLAEMSGPALAGILTICGVGSVALGTILAIGELW